jgi:hypothetical protein
MDERMKDRAFYAFSVAFTPIALFFDALGLLGMLRGSLSGSTLTAVACGLIVSLFAFITRPKIAKAQAWRFVLILLGILVAALSWSYVDWRQWIVGVIATTVLSSALLVAMILRGRISSVK